MIRLCNNSNGENPINAAICLECGTSPAQARVARQP
jgi:hypothetical protein